MSKNGCRQMSNSLKVFDILEKWHDKSKKGEVKRQGKGIQNISITKLKNFRKFMFLTCDFVNGSKIW